MVHSHDNTSFYYCFYGGIITTGDADDDYSSNILIVVAKGELKKKREAKILIEMQRSYRRRLARMKTKCWERNESGWNGD